MFARMSALYLLFAFLVSTCPRSDSSVRGQIRSPEFSRPTAGKRPITVKDAIEMTRLADPDYFSGADSRGRVAQFSPDGRQFVVVLRKGNLEENKNEYSLLLYRTVDALNSPRPDVLAKMSSSSNRDAIARVRWLSDNETIVFLGENVGEASQIYELSVSTRRLRKRTNHPTSITNYDCTADGRTMLFEADSSEPNGPLEAKAQNQGIVITDQSLGDLLAGHYNPPDAGEQLFLQIDGEPPRRISIPPGNLIYSGSSLRLSANGRCGLVRANLLVRDLPRGWTRYDFGQPNDEILHSFFDLPFLRTLAPFARYLTIDTERISAASLWDAPVLGELSLTWAGDGNSVQLAGARLPLDGVDQYELQQRRTKTFDVEISLVTGEYRKVAKADLVQAKKPPLLVTLEEDTNSPPKIFVSDAERKLLLLDLNPQFAELDFGKVELLEWRLNGTNLTGGLYLPPDYVPGRRYPLVIQEHGFGPNRFSMDGLQEWSSAFAARPLAAKGFVVLQAQGFKTAYDHDHYNDDGRFAATPVLASREVNVLGIEAAIEALQKRGLIESGRVGIIGFSRTVWIVARLLTHSKFHFAAASLVDGVDGGYFQDIAYPELAWDKSAMNGSAAPFGRGLNSWLQESPSFSLGNINSPIRLLALGKESSTSAVLDLWEWFAALSLQRKPVEYVFIPNATHTLVKPLQRVVAQQGLVDWFRFWLKREEDSDPAKAEQYARWRELRKMQEENEKK